MLAAPPRDPAAQGSEAFLPGRPAFAPGAGTLVGLGLAVAAALVHVLLAARGAEPSGLAAWGPPLALALAGGCAGAYCDQLRARLARVAGSPADLEAAREELERERLELARLRHELQNRAAEARAPFGLLAGAAARLGDGDREHVLREALDLVETNLGAEATVLDVERPERPEIVAWCGRGDPEPPLGLAATLRHPLVRRALDTGAPAEALDADAPGPRMVVPVRDASGTVAILCLDRLPEGTPEREAVRTFAGIAEWAACGLVRLGPRAPLPAVRREREAPAREPHEVADAGSFVERVGIEYARGARYDVPFSVVGVRIAGVEHEDEEFAATLDALVSELLGSDLRGYDTLHRLGAPGCYAVLLGCCSGGAAKAVVGRLERSADGLREAFDSPVELAILGPEAGHGSVDELLAGLSAFCASGGDAELVPGGRNRLAEVDARPLHLSERARVELEFARRHGAEFQLLEIHSVGPRATDLGARMVELARSLLRPIDGVFQTGERHCVVLLPGTSARHVDLVGVRLVRALTAATPGAQSGDYDFRTFVDTGLDMDPDELLELIRAQTGATGGALLDPVSVG